MTSAWETIRQDARQSPRYKLRLTASVSIDEEAEEAHLPSILAYTRDVSKGGLSLIVPAAGLGFEEAAEAHYALRITLALPTEIRIELLGESIYILPYRAGDQGRECVIGVRLKETESLRIYHEFIESVVGY